jgi:heme exporter protein B
MVAWKDIRMEVRGREQITSMFFFALLVLFVFNFTLVLDSRTTELLMPGLIWVAFCFTGLIGLGRSFQSERDNQCIEALLMAPVGKGAIYLGKLLGNFLFMLAVEIVLFPLFVLFFNLDVSGRILQLAGVFVLGTLGLAALGTLFSAMTMQSRAREVMFPILLLPLAIPVLIGAVQATGGILAHEPWSEFAHWVQLLAVFNLIFVVLGYWGFELILEE